MYSLPYILLVLFFFLISIIQLGLPLEEKSRKTLNSIALLFYILFFGFRGFIGWDWYNYYPYFKQISLSLSFSSLKKEEYEIGFVYFSKLLKLISSNYHFFIFVFTGISAYVLDVVFKRYIPSKYYALAFAFFVPMSGVILATDLIRNFISLLLFMHSLKYIEERKLSYFLFFNFVGLAFHWTAIFYFPLYLILHKKFDLRVYIAIFIIGNIIYLTQLEYITPIVRTVSKILGGTTAERADLYFKSTIYNRSYGITLGYLERLMTSLLIIFYIPKLTKYSKSSILFINSFFIYFIIYFYFSEVHIIVQRFGYLFVFSYWILYPLIIITAERVIRYVIFGVISLYLILRIHNMTNNILYKYDNVLIKQSLNYEKRVVVFDKNASLIQKQQ